MHEHEHQTPLPIIESIAFKSQKNDQLAFEFASKNHSYYSVWRSILNKLLDNTIKSKKFSILDVCSGQGYFVHEAINMGINANGIDLDAQFITKYESLFPDNKNKISQKNFFRFAQKDFDIYDTFVFLKVLEYSENDLAYIKAIPTKKQIVACYPNWDNGLNINFFNNEQDIKNHLKGLVDIQAIETINISNHTHFLPPQKVFIIYGNKV